MPFFGFAKELKVCQSTFSRATFASHWPATRGDGRPCLSRQHQNNLEATLIVSLTEMHENDRFTMRMLDSPWECWIHHEHARFAMIPLVLSWECLLPHENACVTATARCCSTANLPHWLMAIRVFYQSIAPTSLGECQPGWRAVERSGKEWTQEAGWVSFLMPGQPQRQAAMDWAVKLTAPATDWVV